MFVKGRLWISGKEEMGVVEFWDYICWVVGGFGVI